MGALFKTTKEREQERIEKRFALMLAAVRMFNERGFHATLLNHVAASLDATKPSVYHYLGNKDQLLLGCLREGLQEALDAVDVALTEAAPTIATFGLFIEEYALSVMGDFGGCVARTGDELLSEASREEVRDYKAQLHGKTVELISRIKPNFTEDEADLIAKMTAGSINGLPRWFPLASAPDRVIAQKISHSLCKLMA